MDGAFTVPPRVLAVPPVRNTSASSMQSPPASAEATSVIILSLVFARPGASPRSRRCRTSSGRPRCRLNETRMSWRKCRTTTRGLVELEKYPKTRRYWWLPPDGQTALVEQLRF